MENRSMPLKGIKVVELSTHVAMPSCGRLLSYMGADVVKLESLSGEPYRKYGLLHYVPKPDEAPVFDVLNAGKKSVCVNLKNPEVRAYIYKLIAQADVFISNIRMAGLERMQMDYESLKKINPQLIYGHFSGYGERGPLAGAPGFDATTYFTRHAIYRDFVPADAHPVAHIIGMGDLTSGLAMALSVTAAICKKERTGEGEFVTSALNQTAAWVLTLPFVYEQYGKHLQRDADDPLTPYEANYRCADGEWVMISASTDVQWAALCKTAGREDLLADARFATTNGRIKHSKELYAIFSAYAKTIPSKEFLQLMRDLDIPAEMHQHIADLPKDEQLRANDYIYDYDYPSRKVTMPWPPFSFHEADVNHEIRGDKLGGHTAEVLRAMGCSEEELDRFEASGDIIAPR